MSQVPSRIHFLVAKEAPVVVVLQRKVSKLYHIIRIDAETLAVEEGSWFGGKLYPMRCDLSFDGQYMVYFAMSFPFGKKRTWNAVCRPPWLKVVAECDHLGTRYGGGWFERKDLLRTNSWWRPLAWEPAAKAPLPFTFEDSGRDPGMGDLGVLIPRLERDGFERLRPELGNEFPTHQGMAPDDGWTRGPGGSLPNLIIRRAGYRYGDRFEFRLERHPALLTGTTWANWDSLERLWVVRPGTIERWTLRDLEAGRPSFLLDLDKFEPRSQEPLPSGDGPG